MCVTKLLPIVFLSILIIDGKTRTCFNHTQSEYPIVEKEKNTPIEFTIQQETMGIILTSMMKIYLEEVLGFRRLTESRWSDVSGLEMKIKMVDWISSRPPNDLTYSYSHRNHSTPIEIIGWQGWFVPTKFSNYNHWMMFQNPKFALRHPANSTAITMIENSTKNQTSSKRSDSPCTVMLVSEVSPELISQIDKHRLYIQVYDVGPHLGRVTTSLLESYPSVFFILLHRYPSELTHSREKFVAIENPGPNEFFNLYNLFMESFHYKDRTPTLFRVMKNAYLSPQEYLQLLKEFNDRSDDYEVACNWLRENKDRALRWIEEPKEEFVIGVILPTESKDYSDTSFFETVALVRKATEKLSIDYKLQLLPATKICSNGGHASRDTIDCNRLIGVVGPPHSFRATSAIHIPYIAKEYGSFATMGTIGWYKYLYAKFFAHFDWRRVAVIAGEEEDIPDSVLKSYIVFRMENISVLSIQTVPDRWGFTEITNTLLDIIGTKLKIVVVDEPVRSIHAIVCAAFHLNMTAERGYVWCLSGFFNPDWWRRTFLFKDRDISCTSDDLFKVIDGHFNVGQVYFGRDRQIEPALARYAGFLYDACWVFIDAFNRIDKNVSNRMDYIRRENSEQFRDLIQESDFDGLSGRVRFDGRGLRRVDYRIEQFVNDSYRTVAISRSAEDKLSQMEFSSIVWVSGSIPTDGRELESISTPHCIFKSVSEAFNVSCDDAYFIVVSIILVSSVLPIVIFFIVYKKQYKKGARIRKSLLKSRGRMIAASQDLSKLEMRRNDIVMDRLIGEGAFGKVHKAGGLFSDVGWITVAVKSLKMGSSIVEKSDFLTELEVMRTFDHPNLVKLLGVCTKTDPILTVMEFMVHGDLKSFLQDRRETSAERITGMALDVARGLNYLDQSRYVHRDVAARNCLINSELVVKLGDFGLTRPLSGDNYYRFSRRGLFPVRWMAMESLISGVFTPASDIWSFGILVYEIITFGRTPYHEQTNEQVVEYLKTGHTLPIPEAVKAELRNFMSSCWMTNPKERPTAGEIIAALEINPILIQPVQQ